MQRASREKRSDVFGVESALLHRDSDDDNGDDGDVRRGSRMQNTYYYMYNISQEKEEEGFMQTTALLPFMPSFSAARHNINICILFYSQHTISNKTAAAEKNPRECTLYNERTDGGGPSVSLSLSLTLSFSSGGSL